MRGLPKYIHSLKVSQGPLAGQPVKLLGWESRFVAGAFADGVSVAALSIGRGNGKTTLTAALAACPKISWLAGWRASVGDNYSRRLQPLASQ